MCSVSLGLYEKALPQNLNWLEKFNLLKELGFSHLEFSIDETDERIQRLDWSESQRKEIIEAMDRTGIRIQNMMLSAHRRFPLGSLDVSTQKKSVLLLKKAIDLALTLGIRNIQLAGYDVFYEEKSVSTREIFIENLKKCVYYASNKGVMLSIETMDDPFINAISKILWIKKEIRSPWLQAYPDLGNLSAWPMNDIAYELENGIDSIASIHLKDTLAVTESFSGKFKNVPFGSGDVDFVGCLKLLKRLKYQGSFTIEMWNEEVENPIEQIVKAKTFFDQIFEEIKWEQENLLC